MAASTSGASDVLRSTPGKENHQRLTRLLIAGGTRLLREVFESKRPQGDLDVVLNASERKILLKSKKANLTKPQLDLLYPPGGEDVNPEHFDISLLFKLLTLICNLNPPALPKDGDHNLESDLARIRIYRNTVHGHIDGSMEVTDEKFESLWVEISEALIRISETLGKKQEWSVAIKELLRRSLTPEDERLVEADRKAWCNDKDVEKSPTDVEYKAGQTEKKVEEIHSDNKRMEKKIDAILRLIIEFRSTAGQRLNVQDGATVQVLNENIPKLVRHLEEKPLNLKVHDSKIGSLLITVECRSLEILEGLWGSYCSGKLNEMARKYLVTPEFLKVLGVAEVKLKTTIRVEEYRACKQFLKQKEGKIQTADVPASASESGLKPSAPSHEEEENTGKRKASLAFQDSDGKEGKKSRKEIRVASKRKLPLDPPVESAVKDADFAVDVVFALDCCSSISKENITKQSSFVKHLAESLNVLLGSKCRAAVIAYADSARVVNELDQAMSLPFSLGDVHCGENRRMDLALEKASALLKSAGRRHTHQIVILITGGRQSSGREHETDNDDIQSASNSLFSLGSQIVVIPVGMDIDFKELGLMIKRSQSMFPLLSFDDLEPDKADEIADEIMETMDLVPYTKRKVEGFVDLRTECGYGEKIRECLDVIEGIWYMLYEQKNSRRKTQMGKVEEVIREGIDSFHSRLVSECSTTFSIAVFGPYGAGKSHFLNLLLNCDLPNDIKMPDGPLPSGEGDSQTPLPIRVKYATRVNVLKHMRESDQIPVELYSADGLGPGTLLDINKCLKATFESSESVKDVEYIEVQGPFPIFQMLKERKVTSSGHLELDVAVEIVDLPGIRQEKRSFQELNKADVILFFQSGRAKRPVSSEDIVQVFRHHDVFEFMSRPKLIHLDNFSRDNADAVYDESRLFGEKRNDLRKAWVDFFEPENQDKGTCYTDAREKLPLLGGEDLLEKLSDESEVVVLLQDHSASFNSLKKAINRHVETVVVKKSTHSVLKDVLWMAIKLRAQLHARNAKEGRKAHVRKVIVESKNFKILHYQREAEELVDLFLSKNKPYENGVTMEQALKTHLRRFLCSDETSFFLAKVLFRSLVIYSRNVINSVEDAWISASKDIPDGARELAEVFCDGRVKLFCDNRKDHLSNVLKKLQNQTFKGEIQDAGKQYIDICDEKEDRSAKKTIFSKFLLAVLEKAAGSLEGRLRVKQIASIPSFCEDLKRSVESLFDIESSEMVLGDQST